MAWNLKNKALQKYLDEQSNGEFTKELQVSIPRQLEDPKHELGQGFVVTYGTFKEDEGYRAYLFSCYEEELENTNTEGLKVYIAGDIMSKGSQYELEEITKVVEGLGLDYYSPVKNKSINDKHNLTEEENNCLAERIVEADSNRLEDADIIIFNIKQHALGTLCELGQCYQMLRDSGGLLEKEFVFLYDDMRRETNLNEKNDRRSWGINQYVYGLVLALSRGKGFVPFEELCSNLSEAITKVKEYKEEESRYGWDDDYDYFDD